MKRTLAIEQLERRDMLAGLTLTFSNTETVRYEGTEIESGFSFDGLTGPVNVIIEDLPTQALPDSYSLDEDTALIVEAPGVLENDTGITEVELVAGPTHGHAVLNRDGSLIYVPDPDFYGDDLLIYGQGDITALVLLSVTNVNDPPNPVDDVFLGVEDVTLVTGSVLDNDEDIDGDPLTVVSYTQPEHGEVAHNGDGLFRYTPEANFFGTDAFAYTVTDNKGGTASATVTLTVAPVNDRPEARPDAYSTRNNEPLRVTTGIGLLVNDTDVDGDPIAGTTVTSEPSHGAVTVTDSGAFLYIPDAEYTGEDSFKYKASDGELWSEPALVTIAIVESSLPRVRSEVYLSGPDGISVDAAMGVLANDMPEDGLTASIVVLPSHGLLVMEADGSFTYVPNVGYAGADPFTYRATDADGLFGDMQSAFWVTSAAAGDWQPTDQPERQAVAGVEGPPPSGVPLRKPKPGQIGKQETFPPLAIEHPPVTVEWSLMCDIYAYSLRRKPNRDPILSPEYVDRYYGGMA